MTSSLFQEGGPHNIRRIGPDQYSMSISLPKDSHGRLARECPSGTCSPGYFKVKPRTGIASGQEMAYCPYCRHGQPPNGFTTQEQIRYGKNLMMREAHKGIGRMIGDAFGLGPSNRKKYGGDFLSLEVTYNPGTPPHVRHPFEEELERAVICPHCGLDHAVFGLAVWCSDCGRDIFMTHVKAEYDVVGSMLADVDRRQAILGPRAAARDIENSSEDTVSIYEAVLRALLTRYLREHGAPSETIDSTLRKIGNGFQNIARSKEIVERELAANLFDPLNETEVKTMSDTFEKRNPITHNLGVIDRKYLERVLFAEREGREVRVTANEITDAISSASKVLCSLHARLFPQLE